MVVCKDKSNLCAHISYILKIPKYCASKSGDMPHCQRSKTVETDQEGMQRLCENCLWNDTLLREYICENYDGLSISDFLASSRSYQGESHYGTQRDLNSGVEAI